MPYEVKQRSKTLPSKFSEEIHNRHTFNLSTLLNIRALCDWNSLFRTETFLTWQEPQSAKRHQRIAFPHSSLDCSYFQGWSLVWQTLIHEHVDVRSNSTANTNLGITWFRMRRKGRSTEVITITDIFNHRFLDGAHAVTVFWVILATYKITCTCKLKETWK